MEITLKKNKIFVFFFVLILSFSCSDNIVFTEYKTLDGAEWKAQEKINFEFEISDTIKPINLFINLRNNQKYAYSNLFVITEMNFPNGTKVIDTLQYEMANEKGEYLGQGISSIKENRLFYKEHKIFPNTGLYSVSIRHAMRKSGAIIPIDAIEGVQDVGFTIEKIK